MNAASGYSIAKVRALIDAGSLDSAIEELKALLAAEPSDAYAQALLAACFLDKGFSDDALKEAETALTLDPASILAHRVIGLAMLRQKDFVEAEAALRRAIELDPEDAESHRLLGIMFDSHANLKAARAAFEEAIRLDPNDPSVLASYAEFLVDKGELDAAESIIGGAPDHLVDNSAMLLVRGNLALRRNDPEKARDFALWALKHDAQNSAAISLLSQTKMRGNPVMALWWRWAMLMQRFDGKTRVLILIGLWAGYNVAARTVLRSAPEPVQIGAAVAWLSFCLLTWIGPAVLGRMVAKELRTVTIRPDF